MVCTKRVPINKVCNKLCIEKISYLELAKKLNQFFKKVKHNPKLFKTLLEFKISTFLNFSKIFSKIF